MKLLKIKTNRIVENQLLIAILRDNLKQGILIQ
jgi:hypothetical protein